MPHTRHGASHPLPVDLVAQAARASPWVRRWSHLVAPGAAVLDVAGGLGRHTAWFAQRGHAVWHLDGDAAASAAVAGWPGVHTQVADLENAPWPLRLQGASAPGEAPRPQLFGAVVVTHYLWRPLLPTLAASVAEGGVLIYETFAQGQATVGRPARPDFLLRPGELLAFCAAHGLRVVAYEDGFLPQPERFVQRVAAVREPPASAA